MNFRKVGEFVIKSGTSGEAATLELPPKAGGRAVKTLQYFIKVLYASSATTQVGMNVQHGPQVGWYEDLKIDIIAFTPVEEGKTLEGAIGAGGANAEVVGEVILPVLKIKDGSSAAEQKARVEVFEMRKPF